jgi:arsenate reductase (thioredoxin)
MAEGFAKHYGNDVLTAASAGLSPTHAVARNTVKVMGEMNVNISKHQPRLYNPFEASECDIVVNMAGYELPGPPPKAVMEWVVGDPIGAPMEIYRMVRDDLEQRVMGLILDLRKQTKR